MPGKSLQSHLLRLIGGTLMLVLVAIVFSVWLSTDSYVRAQIDNDLDVGFSILDRLMVSREKYLLTSAEVLAADFGFKQAVASRDVPTIQSALRNHGERIQADLMAMLSLNGQVIASTNTDLRSDKPFPQQTFVQAAVAEGTGAGVTVIGGETYQVIILPVRAPLPVGLAVIGFRLDAELANDLKQMTQLDVTFSGGAQASLVSTLDNIDLDQLTESVGVGTAVNFFSRRQFITKAYSVNQQGTLTVYMTASLADAQAGFDNLQLEIMAIALIAIALAMIGGTLFSRTLTQPLQQLADWAAEIAGGDYRKEVRVKRNVREISELSTAFNRMQGDLAERESRIIFQARHDSLTGLINREYATEQLEQQLTQAVARPLWIMVINVLGFRALNDTFGHAVGDSILCEVTRRLDGADNNSLIMARLAGNEFLLVLTSPSDAEAVLAGVASHLQVPYQLDDVEINLQFGIGIAVYPGDGDSAATLLQRASIALDTASRENKSLAFFSREQEESYRLRLTLLTDLKRALTADDGQLMMFYQPKVAAGSLTCDRFEALIRWQHPTRGMVPPDVFIPLAEQSGLIVELTNWVIETVVQQIAQWLSTGFSARVAINLSARDLQSKNILYIIEQLLLAYQVQSSQLMFEVTESEVMRNPEQAIGLLQQFRSHGFELAIDDFGTGYSSLSQLKNMPVTELKIDRAFIMKLADMPDDQIIVRSTIDMAKSFNLAIVAEGVENQAAVDLLRQWDVDWMQGYFFSRPLPANDVIDWVGKLHANAL